MRAISTLILLICFVRTLTSNRTYCYGKFLYKFNISCRFPTGSFAYFKIQGFPHNSQHNI